MFDREEEFLNKSHLIDENSPKEVIYDAYFDLRQNYEKLLEEMKIITKVSDRLHNKLSNLHDKISQKAQNLEDTKAETDKENDKLVTEKNALTHLVAERTKELSETMDDLLELNEDYEHFVYRSAHDILGPIARILGICQLVEMENGIYSEDYFKIIKNEADLLHKITQKLLSVHDVMYHQTNLEKLNTEKFIQKAIFDSTHFKNFEAVKIETNIINEIESPHIDTNILHLTFKYLLEFIFTNLNFENKNPKLVINVIFFPENLLIFFEYNGNCIRSEDAQKIFKMFHQKNDNEEKIGVELYSARQAVKKIGGEIELISSNAIETIFSLRLPIQ